MVLLTSPLSISLIISVDGAVLDLEQNKTPFISTHVESRATAQHRRVSQSHTISRDQLKVSKRDGFDSSGELNDSMSLSSRISAS